MVGIRGKAEKTKIGSFIPGSLPGQVFYADADGRLIGTGSVPPGDRFIIAYVTATGKWVNTSPVDFLAHAELSDMPDTTGVNTDHDNRYAQRTMLNGTFKESFDALVVTRNSDTEVWITLEQTGNGDLTMQFSDFDTTLDCTGQGTPSTFQEVELTVGSDNSPQKNFVYIPKSTKVLTVSTSDFPNDSEHIRVGFFFVPSAAHVLAEGAYANQNHNDYLADTNNQGHIAHIGERIRHSGAQYASGLDPNGNDGSGSSYFNSVDGSTANFKMASGVVYQMHRHSFPAFDTGDAGDDVHMVNWNGDNYHELSNLFDIIADSIGGSLSNKYFNVFFFAVGNKSGEYAPLMAKVAGGSYVTQSSAENDVDGFDDNTMPREFSLDSSTGVPICRMTLRWTGGFTTLSHISTVDLRNDGLGGGGGGSGGSSITNFPSNQFTVFDVTDDTKIMAFDVSNVSAGNTRTYIAPDLDGTLALLEIDQTFTGLNTFTQDVTIGDGSDIDSYDDYRNQGVEKFGVGWDASANLFKIAGDTFGTTDTDFMTFDGTTINFLPDNISRMTLTATLLSLGVALNVGSVRGTPDEITATSEGVAASILTLNTEVTTNGDSDLDNVTLANGITGQIKHIYCVVEGNAADTWKITPATMIGGTQITFAGVGEGCTLIYADNEGWCIISNNGGTIS